MKRVLYIIAVIVLAVFFYPAYGETRYKPLAVRAGLLSISMLQADDKGRVDQLALRRVFDCFKIPYDIIKSMEEIEKYRVVYLSGPLDNRTLDPKLANQLYGYVEGGGTLIAAGEIGNRLFSLFGVEKAVPSRKRYRLTFSGEDPSLRYINRPEESTISLGNGEMHIYDEVIWTIGYHTDGGPTVLARFEDEMPGFLTGRYGRGKTYLLGISYTDSVLVPQIGKDYEAQRLYVNSFEPSGDVVMLLLRAVYEASVSPSVQISTLPYALPAALVLSHDVDAQTSFVDSLKYADLEERFGVTSTFFENTKYFTDWMDIDYYNIPANVEAIREVKKRGWDIGSHTVSHYKKLSQAPEGNPRVRYKSYHPEKQVTVQGEVRVSKQLLDRDIPGQNTVSFRAGDLEYPDILVRVLEDAGYLYNSTFSTNDVLTAFPFRAMSERNLGSSESNMFEIPITLDDSLGFLTPSTLESAVKTWREVTQAYSENDALTVLLIHPSDTRKSTFKLDAQEALMKEVVKMNGWMGNITEFGEFWRARDALDFTVSRGDDGTLLIKLNIPASSVHPMVGFVVEKKRNITTVAVQDSRGTPLQYTAEERNGKLYLRQK